MSKPVIGVLPQYSAENNRIMIVENFFNSVRAAGGIPVLLPLRNESAEVAEILERFDGFLYPGGPDISPFYFGEEAAPEYGNIVPERDKIELELLPEIIKTGRPVFGICRGIQVMNVALGGTLIQNIPTWQELPVIQGEERGNISAGTTEAEQRKRHRNEALPCIRAKLPRIGHYQQAGNEVQTHLVKVERNTLLYDIVKKDTLKVNTFHHQACKELARSLVLNATSADGIIEAIAMEHHRFFLGVQWHPEHLFFVDEDMAKIWRAFIRAAEG